MSMNMLHKDLKSKHQYGKSHQSQAARLAFQLSLKVLWKDSIFTGNAFLFSDL
jgi:hypothetical protein